MIRSPCCWRPCSIWPMPARKPRPPRRCPSIPSPTGWTRCRPRGQDKTPPEAPADASVAVLEDTLLHGEVSPSQLAQRWEGATGAILLACILSYHGVSLEVIGRFFGVHNTT